MAGTVNKVILIGHLGSDPEFRQMDNGQSVTRFSIATSYQWTPTGSNQKKEKTEWHRIVVWGNLADPCEKYLKKGSKCYVEGSIDTNKWEDKEGNTRYTVEIKAREVKFLDSKSDDRDQRTDNRGDSRGGQKRQQQGQPPKKKQDDFDYGAPAVSDENIPF